MADVEITYTEDCNTRETLVYCPSKRREPIKIAPVNRWGHFGISASNGPPNKELAGTFTSRDEALDKVRKFLYNSPKSPSVKRAEIREDRARASSTKSKGS